MSNSCIITVTEGDFLYINEWIEYHRNLGVNLFLIGYNGYKKNYDKLPQYDYVRYFDFSKDSDPIYNGLNCLSQRGFSGFVKYEDALKDKRILHIQSKIFNILLETVQLLYPSIKYSIVIDTDEFIDIKSENKNINDFLDKNFPNHNSSWSIEMEFYTDNNLIYYDDRPCIERFTEKDVSVKYFGLGCSKIIINMYHNDTINGKCFMLSSHHCGLSNPDRWRFNINDIALKHFWTKTLEEWIMKMNNDYDSDYFRRFHGRIFNDFFYHTVKNKITKDKIKAIPVLLEKYNIKYNPGKDEWNKNFTDIYNKINFGT